MMVNWGDGNVKELVLRAEDEINRRFFRNLSEEDAAQMLMPTGI